MEIINADTTGYGHTIPDILTSTEPSLCGMGDGVGILISPFSKCEMYISAPEGQTDFATGHGACCELVDEVEV